MRSRPAILVILLFPLLVPAFTARTGSDCGLLDDAEKGACFQEVAAGRAYQPRMVVRASEESSPSGPGNTEAAVDAAGSPLFDTVTTLVVSPKGDTTRTIEVRRSDVHRKNLIVATTRLAYTTMTTMAVGLAIVAIGLIAAITD